MTYDEAMMDVANGKREQHICPYCGSRKPPDIMGISLDIISCVVTYQGREVHLMRQRALMLKCLLDAHPMPVDRNSLYRIIWGESVKSEGIVRVVACQLRRTLADAGLPVTVKANRSIGYWLEAA